MTDTLHLLTEREFAERFRVSPRTLQRWREVGDGPEYVRLGDRRIAYPLTAALQWLDNCTHKSRADELAKAARGRRVAAPTGRADNGST